MRIVLLIYTDSHGKSFMDLGQRKEQFSQAYLQAVASAAGFTLAEPKVDDDSVDWSISARGPFGALRSPRLDLQLKCTEVVANSNGYFNFPLKVKNYKDLRGTDLHIPRILVVVFVPDDVEYWIDQDEERLIIKHCAYWASLRNEPQTENRRTVSVQLPRRNQFTVASLTAMIRQIGNGGAP